ncbi:MAG: hypothetical protein ACM31D_01925 [Bacteroidota bacterium]
MLRPALAAALILAVPTLAAAQGSQAPINLLPPSTTTTHEAMPPVPAADKPLLDEPAPNFQPLRPAEPETLPPTAQQPQPAPVPAVAAPAERTPEPPAATIAEAPPPPAAMVPPPPAPADLPAWALGVLVLSGAFLAAMFGILTSLLMRRAEITGRRRAVAATLATELETRRLAYEAVPLPPNVEAGVSFVSSVTSLAGIDAGFRSVQGNLHLLPEKIAANVSVHYAAVQRVSDFVKGQSLAAAVRMLQANRLGGHPCPDAGAMREAHVELGAAFRGVDKLVQMLRAAR